MPKQTPAQLAAFQELCRANNLDPRADVWQQKQSGQWIIGRTGIEKIQGLNNIGIELNVVGFGIDYAGVKCTATRSLKVEGARTAKKLTAESLGSAHPKNCTQISYYLEMAEKRAKSRAVLMLMGFYALGVYGEDEADDFQRKADSLPGQADEAPAPTPPAPPAASNSAAPVASTGAAPSPVSPEQTEELRQQLEKITSKLDLKALFEKLTPEAQEQLKPLFTATRARIEAAIAQAAATPVVRPVGPPAASPVRETGSDSVLVDAYVNQPTMLSGSYPLLTDEQYKAIYGLLNNPLITRKEKTAALLNIKKMDTERARQLLTTLRTAITEREGYHTVTEAEQVGEVRAAIGLLLKQYAGKLEIEDEGALQVALANSRATLEELEAVLRAGREAAWDAENDGTEREHLEQEITA